MHVRMMGSNMARVQTQCHSNMVNQCKVGIPGRLVELVPIVCRHKRRGGHIVRRFFGFLTYHFRRTCTECQIGPDHNGFGNPIQRLLVMGDGRLAQNVSVFFK